MRKRKCKKCGWPDRRDKHACEERQALIEQGHALIEDMPSERSERG